MTELLLRSKRPIKASRRPIPQRISPFEKRQREESREIAQRVHVRQESNRLEKLLSRLGNSKPDALSLKRRNPQDLEYLAIAQRADQRYEIIVSGSHKPITGIIFETIKHCAEAATELEHQFDMSRCLNSPSGETQESIEAIVREHWWRETVEQSFTAA
jgi:uncharacterized protein YgbK (DUF1537 family)